jgi:hypothetical protein
LRTFTSPLSWVAAQIFWCRTKSSQVDGSSHLAKVSFGSSQSLAFADLDDAQGAAQDFHYVHFSQISANDILVIDSVSNSIIRLLFMLVRCSNCCEIACMLLPCARYGNIDRLAMLTHPAPGVDIEVLVQNEDLIVPFEEFDSQIPSPTQSLGEKVKR